jgi:hypothetical protein
LSSSKNQAKEEDPMDYINLAPNQEVKENGLIYEFGSLYMYFDRVSDTRDPRGKLYSLLVLLVLIMLAKLGGEDNPSRMANWVFNRMEQLVEMKILSGERATSNMT